MQIRDWVTVFLKRWWVVLAIVVITSGTSYAVSRTLPHTYRATTFVSVLAVRNDLGNQLSSNTKLKNFAIRVPTYKFTAELLKSFDVPLDLPLERVRSEIVSTAILEDNEIQIDVTDTNQFRAIKIANAAADLLVGNINDEQVNVDSTDKILAQVLDYAHKADIYFPKTKTNVLVGALLGLILAGLLVFLLEYLDDTIKTTEDLDRYLNITALGVIPTIIPKTTVGADSRSRGNITNGAHPTGPEVSSSSSTIEPGSRSRQ